jgi:hypothetical protein
MSIRTSVSPISLRISLCFSVEKNMYALLKRRGASGDFLYLTVSLLLFLAVDAEMSLFFLVMVLFKCYCTNKQVPSESGKKNELRQCETLDLVCKLPIIVNHRTNMLQTTLPTIIRPSGSLDIRIDRCEVRFIQHCDLRTGGFVRSDITHKRSYRSNVYLVSLVEVGHVTAQATPLQIRSM